MPQPQGARLPPPRLHPPHAAKALQSSMMFPDRTLGRPPADPQQRAGDRLPFLVERRSAGRLAGATVPIGGVAGVAFLAMEVGVDPIAIPALVSLCGFVCAVPIAARVKPQRAQSGSKLAAKKIRLAKRGIGRDPCA